MSGEQPFVAGHGVDADIDIDIDIDLDIDCPVHCVGAYRVIYRIN